MSILTKISIVILLVLILLACPVFIYQAVITPNYKDAYLRETVATAAATEQTRQANFALEQAKRQRDLALSNAAMVQSRDETTIDNLHKELETSKKDYVTLRADINDLREKLGQLQVSYDAVEKRRQLLEDQRKTLLDKVSTLQQESREMASQLKDATAQVTRLQMVANVLREELKARDDNIKDLSEKIHKLEEGGAKTAAKTPESPAEPPTSVPIEGTLDAVKGDVASINVGSAKGVKTGMRLIIFRGDKFVANLRIDEVDINQSVGLITDRKLDPIQGDKVMSRR